MFIVIAWILFGLVTAIAAHQKGRNVAGWFIFGFLIPPLALICILVASHATVASQATKGSSMPMNEKIKAIGPDLIKILLVFGILIALLIIINV